MKHDNIISVSRPRTGFLGNRMQGSWLARAVTRCGAVLLLLGFTLLNPLTALAVVSFDNELDSSCASTSCTDAFTMASGSNGAVMVGIEDFQAAGNVTSCTYNGSSLTKAFATDLATPGGGEWQNVWYGFVASPDGAAHNVVCNYTSGVGGDQTAIISYLGVRQGTLDATSSNTVSNNGTFTESHTTITDNSWVTQFFRNNIGGATIGSGATKRGTTNYASRPTGWVDSNQAVTPAGGWSMTISNGNGSTKWAGSFVSLAPSVAAAAVVPTPPNVVIFGDW